MPRALLTLPRRNDRLIERCSRSLNCDVAYAVLIASGDVISFPLAGVTLSFKSIWLDTSSPVYRHGDKSAKCFLGETCSLDAARGQMPINACDQVWNADRLGQKGMPLDPETRSCLRFRDQTREKNNRRSVQCQI